MRDETMRDQCALCGAQRNGREDTPRENRSGKQDRKSALELAITASEDASRQRDEDRPSPSERCPEPIPEKRAVESSRCS